MPTTIALSGITSSGGGTITVAATSSNTGIIPTPTVTYTSPNTTGTVNLAPVANSGGATISITVSSTACASVTKSAGISYTTTLGPPTLDPLSNMSVAHGSGNHTVTLSGISYGPGGSGVGPMTVISGSTNPGLIPNPSVTYTNPNPGGSITFADTGSTGTTTIFVTVTDQALIGIGGACVTASFTRSFTVTVT